MCFCQAAALFVSFFCGLVFRNKANIGQTVTARLKEGSKKSASFVLKRKNIFCVGVSTKHQNWHLSVHVLVSSFSRGSRQYRLNAPGDFSSSQGGGCWLRGLACLLACVCVCPFDTAMSLLLSCLGAATRADLGQTLRVTVTFKNNLPLSRKERQCICHFLQLSIPFALCKPLCSYLWREKR